MTADDRVHIVHIRRQQGVHKGQFFLFRAVQVHLDVKFPVVAGIASGDGRHHRLIRHHQRQLGCLAGNQDGAVVAGKVRDGSGNVKREIIHIKSLRQVDVLCLD